MAILKVDTISGIGTEAVFEGDIEFTSQNFNTSKGDTIQRGRGRVYMLGYSGTRRNNNDK